MCKLLQRTFAFALVGSLSLRWHLHRSIFRGLFVLFRQMDFFRLFFLFTQTRGKAATRAGRRWCLSLFCLCCFPVLRCFCFSFLFPFFFRCCLQHIHIFSFRNCRRGGARHSRNTTYLQRNLHLQRGFPRLRIHIRQRTHPHRVSFKELTSLHLRKIHAFADTSTWSGVGGA